MLNLFRSKKGQNTAEYAVLIALVVAAGIAMQTYVKRGMQAGTKFAVDKLKKNTGQYEPYYRESSYDTTQSKYQDTVQTEAGGKVTRVFDVTKDKETKRTGQETTKEVTTQKDEKRY